MLPIIFFAPALIQVWIVRCFFSLPQAILRLVAGPAIAFRDHYVELELQAMLNFMDLNGIELVGSLPLDEARSVARISAKAAERPGRLPGIVTQDFSMGVMMMRGYYYNSDPPNPVNTPSSKGESVERIPLRLYSVKHAPKNAPLLVYLHGGGFVVGGLDVYAETYRWLAASSGAKVLAVDYRLAPEHPYPAAVDDAISAYLWAIENSDLLGIDKRRIAIGGDSAGGTIAVAAAYQLMNELLKPKFLMILYPLTRSSGWTYSKALFGRRFFLDVSDLDWFMTQYAPGDLSAIPFVNISILPDLGRLPETYIGMAGFDPLRDEVIDFGNLLIAAGVKTTLEMHHSLIHGFANFVGVSNSAVSALVAAGTSVYDFFSDKSYCSSSLPTAVANRLYNATGGAKYVSPATRSEIITSDNNGTFYTLRSDYVPGNRVYYHTDDKKKKLFPLIAPS